MKMDKGDAHIMTRVWDPFWISQIQTGFVLELKAIVDILEKRLLPSFEENKIEEESKRIGDKVCDQFMSMPGTGEEDPSYFAEKAENAGNSHYILMNGIRQGMLNLFAATLFHAFEQQIMVFHRKNVLCQSEENDPKLFKWPVFQCRLKKYGINIKEFPSWAKINELRLVANTVKHAEGESSQQLRQERPEMFKNPDLSGFSQFISDPALHVFQPLVGDGLYVSLQDIKEYRYHLVRFWQELADATQNNGPN